MSHRYDDDPMAADPMAYVPYRAGTVTLSVRAFLTLCFLAFLGVAGIVLVLLV